MSTNKVYGDKPNELPLKELDTRWDYAERPTSTASRKRSASTRANIACSAPRKSPATSWCRSMGATSAMKTCCLRGGCLTGPNHSGVELHGFLSYLIRCNIEGRPYRIFGYKGKQVRDNIHSHDVARFIEEFWKAPRVGEVYNLGGGRDNSVSILEAFEIAAAVSGKKQVFEYVDKNREGDHICYISDLAKCRAHYPGWDITVPLAQVFEEIHQSWTKRDLIDRKQSMTTAAVHAAATTRVRNEFSQAGEDGIIERIIQVLPP